MSDVIDLTLDLNEQSWAVLHGLNRLSPADLGFRFDEQLQRYDFNCQTTPWYNGRERGFRLVFRQRWGGPYLAVFFAEARNSDSIIVILSHGNDCYLNPEECKPTEEDWAQRRRYFGPYKVDEVVPHIQEAVLAFVGIMRQDA